MTRRRRTGTGRRSERIGAVRWKLYEMLREAGVPIASPDQFWMQEGAYRGKHWDLARWGADFRSPSGGYFRIYSWDTMTNCTRRGFTVNVDHGSRMEDYTGDEGGGKYYELEIFAKAKPPPDAKRTARTKGATDGTRTTPGAS